MGKPARRWVVAAGLGLTALSISAMPPSGRYAGRLCVATTPVQPPDCGPAELELRAGGVASVRISDIVYRLQLGDGQLDVVLMQGSMQIDGFRAPYAWQGSALQFSDDEKQVRYEVQFGTPKSPAR